MDAMRWLLVLALGFSFTACGDDSTPIATVTVSAPTAAPATATAAPDVLRTERAEFYASLIRKDVLATDSLGVADHCTDAIVALGTLDATDDERHDGALITDRVCLPALKKDWLTAISGLLVIRDGRTD